MRILTTLCLALGLCSLHAQTPDRPIEIPFGFAKLSDTSEPVTKPVVIYTYRNGVLRWNIPTTFVMVGTDTTLAINGKQVASYYTELGDTVVREGSLAANIGDRVSSNLGTPYTWEVSNTVTLGYYDLSATWVLHLYSDTYVFQLVRKSEGVDSKTQVQEYGKALTLRLATERLLGDRIPEQEFRVYRPYTLTLSAQGEEVQLRVVQVNDIVVVSPLSANLTRLQLNLSANSRTAATATGTTVLAQLRLNGQVLSSALISAQPYVPEPVSSDMTPTNVDPIERAAP